MVCIIEAFQKYFYSLTNKSLDEPSPEELLYVFGNLCKAIHIVSFDNCLALRKVFKSPLSLKHHN